MVCEYSIKGLYYVNGISKDVVTVVISGSLPRSTENVKIITSTSMHQPQAQGHLTCG